MTFTNIINEAFKYYKITDKFIESGSVVLKNSNFVDLFINEVNFTAKSFGLKERLERGFNVNSLGDLVVVSPFKKRREWTMLRTTRKIFNIIEKNNLTNVQVLVNMETGEIVVSFSSVKQYKIFVNQYDYKYGLNNWYIDRSEKLIWRK